MGKVECKAYIWAGIGAKGEESHVMVDGSAKLDRVPETLGANTQLLDECGNPVLVNLVIELPKRLIPGMTFVAKVEEAA